MASGPNAVIYKDGGLGGLGSHIPGLGFRSLAALAGQMP